MLAQYQNTLCEYELTYLKHNMTIHAAWDLMQNRGLSTYSFNILLPDVIKHSIKKATKEFSLFSRDLIPMLWIRGPMEPLVFDKEMLILPLLDTEGFLFVEEDVYELVQGAAYIIGPGKRIELKGEDILVLGPVHSG